MYEAGKSLATRSSSGEVINAIAKAVPQLFGGSADLASSNKTLIKGGGNFLPDSYEGRNIWFGVREFAMGAALNGMALHGGLKVFGGTFFVFSDYLRPAIRLAALMGLPVIYVLTHDSIAVGEDGPTHEPIEHLASLRAMPNLSVIRPADANETAAAWRLALESTDKPTALVLTRQDVPTLAATAELAYEGVKKVRTSFHRRKTALRRRCCWRLARKSVWPSKRKKRLPLRASMSPSSACHRGTASKLSQNRTAMKCFRRP